jgi:hypothetical protein
MNKQKTLKVIKKTLLISKVTTKCIFTGLWG